MCSACVSKIVIKTPLDSLTVEIKEQDSLIFLFDFNYPTIIKLGTIHKKKYRTKKIQKPLIIETKKDEMA